MTAHLAATLVIAAALIVLGAWLDRRRYRAYRKRRNEQASAAWWAKREGKQK